MYTRPLHVPKNRSSKRVVSVTVPKFAESRTLNMISVQLYIHSFIIVLLLNSKIISLNNIGSAERGKRVFRKNIM